MNGRTHAYLDLAALPLVGTTLLDHRPAWVFRNDGAAVLWANASGVKFFGEESMGALLKRPIGSANPLLDQIKRLAKTVPTSNPRMEILRIALGFNITALPSACQRIELGDGTSAVLAVAAADGPSEPVTSRAENLADIIAGPDCLVAIIASGGEILGASGEFQNFSPASATIDALAKSIDQSAERIVKQEIQIAGTTHPSGISRFETDDGDPYALLIVGPAEEGMEDADSALATAEAVNKPVSEAQAAPPATPIETSPATPPAIRFLWRADENQRFTFVSPELGDIVGATNAGIVGNSWADVAARLLVDQESSLQAALDGRKQWSGIKVYWPLDDSGLRIAAELSGFPVTELGKFAGFRGFGVLRPDDSYYELQKPDGSTVPDTTPAKAISPETATHDPEPTETTHSSDSSSKPEGPPEGVEKIDDTARNSIGKDLKIVAGRDTRPDETPIPDKTARTARLGERSNVVPLTGTQPPTVPLESNQLSGGEHDAFRRLAETLSAQTAPEKQSSDAEATDQTAGMPDGHPASSTKHLDPLVEPDTRILDFLPIGIVVFRGDDTLFANRTLLDLLGYDSPADFAAAGGHNTFFPDGDPDWTNSPSDHTEGLLSVRGKDGGRRQLEARLQTVTWANAKALMVSFREQSRRKEQGSLPSELVEEIASAEARLGEFEAILDTATDGVVVFDDRGRICNLNRSAEALFGVDASDVLGTLFTGLLAEESRKPALDYLDGLASNGVASVLNDGREVIGKVPKGGLIPLFMTMGRVGKTDKFCAVLRDITYWKNAEEELVAARRAAEAANAQKSEFLAKISHEIRTPLNAIIGFSEVMMEERFGSIGNARYRDYLRDIHISGSHLMSLINDLLDLSKIEAGKLELTFESVAVNETIQECVALMQPQANRERIIIRTSLSSDVPNIVIDPRSLRQILLNLLSNAIKFTGAGGQVIVSTGSEDRGEVVIRIRDTGIGMSEKDIETALKPFRQLATSGQAQGEGTGLGLPLTKALVEANRAYFTIDSTVNQGTLVKITIPTTRVLAG